MEPLESTLLPWAHGVGRSNRPAPRSTSTFSLVQHPLGAPWSFDTVPGRMWATCLRALNHSCWLGGANSFDVLINASTVSLPFLQALTLLSAKLLLRIRMAVVAD